MSEDVTVPVSRAPYSTMTALADYLMLALAILFGAGSIVLFAWSGRPVIVPMTLSPAAALGWDAFLSCVFFIQHSVLVRRPVRAKLASIVPPRYDGAFYSITSGLALGAFAVFFQPVGPPLFELGGIARAVVNAAALGAAAGFAWGITVFRSFDPFGLRPIRAHLRGKEIDAGPGPFVVRGPYAYVRHPLYSCIVVLLWAAPDMTPSRLLVAATWTGWIVVGALLEERDLIADFGEDYREYRRKVPFLVPWRGRVAMDVRS